jgi:hypothetical protein
MYFPAILITLLTALALAITSPVDPWPPGIADPSLGDGYCGGSGGGGGSTFFLLLNKRFLKNPNKPPEFGGEEFIEEKVSIRDIISETVTKLNILLKTNLVWVSLNNV